MSTALDLKSWRSDTHRAKLTQQSSIFELWERRNSPTAANEGIFYPIRSTVSLKMEKVILDVQHVC